jgi:hypothetical protein
MYISWPMLSSYSPSLGSSSLLPWRLRGCLWCLLRLFGSFTFLSFIDKFEQFRILLVLPICIFVEVLQLVSVLLGEGLVNLG